MVLFNYAAKELTAKIVYYGPGLCGKTTNLQYVYGSLPETVKGKMLSLATKTDRTLFFDFLPLDLGEIAGMKTRIQLYTVPGQVFYNETRKLVLTGSDGIVFVADSQSHLLAANIESFKNLEDNLRYHGMKLKDLPLVLQFNKRDLPSLTSVEELNFSLNKYNSPFYEAVATTGIGVQDTLRAITKLVLIHLCKKFDLQRYEEISVVQAPQKEDASLFSNEMTPQEGTIQKKEEAEAFVEQEAIETQEYQQTEVEEEKVAVGIEVSQEQETKAHAGEIHREEQERTEERKEDQFLAAESEIEIEDDLEELELAEEEVERPHHETITEHDSVTYELEDVDSESSESSDAPVAAPVDEEEQTSVAEETAEEERTIELGDIAELPGEEREEARSLRINLGETENVALPLRIELGNETLNLNLVISFKFEQKKEDKD